MFNFSVDLLPGNREVGGASSNICIRCRENAGLRGENLPRPVANANSVVLKVTCSQ